MTMRAVALAVVVSLGSPAIMTALCELSCLKALHHAAGEAYAHDCHGDATEDTDGPIASSAGGALCHDDGEGPPAALIVAGIGALVVTGAVLAVPTALVDPVTHRVHPHSTRAGPPDLLQLTTRLRI